VPGYIHIMDFYTFASPIFLLATVPMGVAVAYLLYKSCVDAYESAQQVKPKHIVAVHRSQQGEMANNHTLVYADACARYTSAGDPFLPYFGAVGQHGLADSYMACISFQGKASLVVSPAVVWCAFVLLLRDYYFRTSAYQRVKLRRRLISKSPLKMVEVDKVTDGIHIRNAYREKCVAIAGHRRYDNLVPQFRKAMPKNWDTFCHVIMIDIYNDCRDENNLIPLDVSQPLPPINLEACSSKVPIHIDGCTEDWLMVKQHIDIMMKGLDYADVDCNSRHLENPMVHMHKVSSRIANYSNSSNVGTKELHRMVSQGLRYSMTTLRSYVGTPMVTPDQQVYQFNCGLSGFDMKQTEDNRWFISPGFKWEVWRRN
jgi:hypothetical protein